MKIRLDIRFDNTSGLFVARVNGGARFYFSGTQDAPLPRSLYNALTALRRETMEAAVNPRHKPETPELPLEEILKKVSEYEQRGGKIQLAGPAPKRPPLTSLTIEDLDL